MPFHNSFVSSRSLLTLFSHSPQNSSFTPSICPPRPLPSIPPPVPHPSINWPGVRDAVLITTLATALAQLPGVPLDAAAVLLRRGGSSTLPTALFRLLRTPRLAYTHFFISTMKRLPTKALTAACYELLSTTIPPGGVTGGDGGKRGGKNVPLALCASVIGVAATYPLHSFYYAAKKGLSTACILSAYRANGALLYAGVLPAALAAAQAAVVKAHVARQVQRSANASGLCVGVAAGVAGSVVAQPLKQVGKKVIVASVKQGRCVSVAQVGWQMLCAGPGGFYKGYRSKMVTVVVSALVAKTAAGEMKRKIVDERTK